MIGLETARKLKEAGLKWEPKVGDWIYNHHGFISQTTLDCIGKTEVSQWIAIAKDYCNRTVDFAPRLDQMLTEIEGQGYGWALDGSVNNPAGNYNCWVVCKGNCECFFADSPEEAAALALFWIYEQKAGDLMPG